MRLGVGRRLHFQGVRVWSLCWLRPCTFFVESRSYNMTVVSVYESARGTISSCWIK